MPLSAKSIRKQLTILQPLMGNLSLKTIRRGQNKIGELMESRYRGQVMGKDHHFGDFSGTWVMPKDQRREGVILYLHGGGYTCGGLEYATGFASTLAVTCGSRVFAAAYRLAPEHRFPAALEDAMTAYRYLLEKGYDPCRVTLCGESAGGGLCYALCQRLKSLGEPMPAGVIALSPWVDLTNQNPSLEKNRAVDPSLTKELLDFFSACYTDTPRDPLASPLLGDLSGSPDSLIFVGEDEILLDDGRLLHTRLLEAGCRSRLEIARERWHAYLLYGLAEDRKDFEIINRFLDQTTGKADKIRWMPLDNAAKIYPAARRPNWSNLFRLSVSLTEEVDREVLRTALDVTVRRFPSLAVKLRKGAFWYYLESLREVPDIMEEQSYPLTRMSKEETCRCAFRVLVYKNRIAIEVFHSLTDGNGAMVFLKSLTAEYLERRYGVHIPARDGILGRLEEPSEGELEDSFQRHGGTIAASRRENTAWHLSGTPEAGGFQHVTCLTLPVDRVIGIAHQYGVSLTGFLTAAMMAAIQELQRQKVPNPRHRKPIKVLIPVNLRKLFPSKTLRNFVLYTTPEILPRLGEYDFGEICRVVRHHMGATITPKQMSMRIATNIGSERLMAVRMMPLFIKNLVMKAVFDSVGEKKSCLSVSNLGAIRLPAEMEPFVERFDFILGVQATSPYNCGVLSYGNDLYINFIRNIREPLLESSFYKVLHNLGLPVTVQSNLGQREETK